MSALDVRGPAWMAHAVCASVDPSIFHPDQGESPKAAKSICATCPVTAECLSWALSTNEVAGIFGGLTAGQRRGMRAA